jgi:hypothetical protein
MRQSAAAAETIFIGLQGLAPGEAFYFWRIDFGLQKLSCRNPYSITDS